MIRWLRTNARATWYESPAGPGLEDVRFVLEKPAALVTLDDRAITFDGTWPAIDTLKNFSRGSSAMITCSACDEAKPSALYYKSSHYPQDIGQTASRA